MSDPVLIAKGATDIFILPEMMSRHGLIAGATGTGKTVTLRILVEGLSRIGVPVFLADIKGDLSGIALPGGGNPKIDERIQKHGMTNFSYGGVSGYLQGSLRGSRPSGQNHHIRDGAPHAEQDSGA